MRMNSSSCLLKISVFFYFFIACLSAFSQSLIVGIPSIDVAEPHHVEVTHETQLNFWQNPTKWNSFNFACYGLGHGAELTTTLNNLSNEGSDNLALGLGAKKILPLATATNYWQSKIGVGGNVQYSTVRANVGIWAYAIYSARHPRTKTRITAGLNYGQSQTFGFRKQFQNGASTLEPNNLATFICGFEQPIYRNVSIIGDWYSGNHDLAAFIPAIQIDLGKNVLILGYKLPNSKEIGNQALIVEFMMSIPTK
jgi:hypothetical protein